MKKFNTKPPSGTRDFLPADVKSREWIFGVIRGVFEGFGFLPMDTPAFERIEILTGKYGKEAQKLIFKILKRGDQAASGEADMALRYDLTVPLARFFSQYQNQLPRPFRRYQIGPVWRADRPGKGRFREFYQCDVDIIGSASLLADAEVIIALAKTLSCLGLSDYVVRLNSRKVLAGLIEAYGIPNKLKQMTLTAFDKLDKVGIKGVIQELRNLGLPETIIGEVSADLSKKTMELKSRISVSDLGREGIKEVEEVLSLVAPLLDRGEIEFFPFLARGLDYYTGPIFEIYLKGATSAIASGGRYDNLIKIFAGKQIPACGGSLGVDRLLSEIKEIGGQTKENATAPQVFLTVWDRASQIETLRIADELRNEGISTEVSLTEGKISDQVRYASKRGVRYCLFYGPNEHARKEVTLKNLSTGEQKSVKREQFAQTLKSFIQRR